MNGLQELQELATELRTNIGRCIEYWNEVEGLENLYEIGLEDLATVENLLEIILFNPEQITLWVYSWQLIVNNLNQRYRYFLDEGAIRSDEEIVNQEEIFNQGEIQEGTIFTVTDPEQINALFENIQQVFEDEILQQVLNSSIDDRGGATEALSNEIVEQMPRKIFLEIPKESIDMDRCTICMEDFAGSDIVMILPCNHFFHPECIKPWFQNSTKCPNCKLDLVINQ